MYTDSSKTGQSVYRGKKATQWLIRDFTFKGGTRRRPPTRSLFSEKTSQNERIGSANATCSGAQVLVRLREMVYQKI